MGWKASIYITASAITIVLFNKQGGKADKKCCFISHSHINTPSPEWMMGTLQSGQYINKEKPRRVRSGSESFMLFCTSLKSITLHKLLNKRFSCQDYSQNSGDKGPEKVETTEAVSSLTCEPYSD